MFAGLAAKLGLGLLFGRVKAFASRVPRWVWIALATVLLFGLAVWSHQNLADKRIAASYALGKSDAEAAFATAMAEKKAETAKWREGYENQAKQITLLEGQKHDAQLRSNAAAADALRLRGAGKAAARSGCRSDPGLSTGAGGSGVPGSTSDAALAGLPADEGLAVVPWGDLVQYAEEADASRSEVTTWRNWYAQQFNLWQAERTKLAAKK